MSSEAYSQAKRELHNSLRWPGSSNFHTQLFRLIAKADLANMHNLRLGFPVQVQVWEDWNNCTDQARFFDV